MAKKEELEDDAVTEGMMLADKDMEIMKKETPTTSLTEKKKLGRPRKRRSQTDEKIPPKKKRRRFARPQLNYAELIAEALRNDENAYLPTCDILSFISNKYPYFKMAVKNNTKWKKSVASILGRDFERVSSPSTQEDLWTMKKGAILRRKRGRPKKVNKMDLEKARAEMAKKSLRIDLVDIGTTIVPKLLNIQNGDESDDEGMSSSVSPEEVSGESQSQLELNELEDNIKWARNRKMKREVNTNLDKEVKEGKTLTTILRSRKTKIQESKEDYEERTINRKREQDNDKQNEELKARKTRTRLESNIKKKKFRLWSSKIGPVQSQIVQGMYNLVQQCTSCIYV